jgi:hypothetical protein
MTTGQQLDAGALLSRVAARIPSTLRPHVIVIGSIAAAWAFRDVSGTYSVATKDIDLLLSPSVAAVQTAESLGDELMDEGWQPRYPNGIQPGNSDTPNDDLPALRLSPPGDSEHWFIELLAEPHADQSERRHWRRFRTRRGHFGLPSFRYMLIAVDGAEVTDYGIRVARPARMALAHLLEHSDPDRTPISSLPGTPARFIKDVGRAISLWWLAREQSVLAANAWLSEWRATLAALHPGRSAEMAAAAQAGLASATDSLREAHAIAINGLLAPHGTSLDAFRRAHAGLSELIGDL